MGKRIVTEVSINSLFTISNRDGDIVTGLKQSDQGFKGFGELYFSYLVAGSIKAWRRHKTAQLNLFVPTGSVRFVFTKAERGPFEVSDLSSRHPLRVTIPSGIWFGFQNLSHGDSLVVSLSDIPHESAEVERLPVDGLTYTWETL